MSENQFREEMREMTEDFVSETGENLCSLERMLVDLEKDPGHLDLLNSVFRIFHSLKGASGFLGFTRMGELAHTSESLLNQLRRGEISVTREVMDIIFEAVDLIKVLLDEIRTGKETGAEIEGIINRIVNITACSKNIRAEDASGSDGNKTSDSGFHAETHFLQPGYKEKASLDQGEGQTIRVSVERLDSLMNLVGELVLTRNRMFKINRELENYYGDNGKIRPLLGKPEKGEIRVAAIYQGDHIVIEVEDDGKGMDPEQLRRTAVEKKL